MNRFAPPPFSLLLILAFSLAGLSRASEPENDYKAALSGWSYGRERKTVTSSNRVTSNFTIKNTSDAALSDVRVTLTLKSGLGEQIADPMTQKVGALKAGESKKVAIVGDFIPVFSAYDIDVEYAGGKKELWFSSSDVGQPQPKTGEPLKGIANVVILGKEATADRSGRFSGVVHVKNEGSIEAKNLRILVTFYDAKKQKIAEITEKLGNGTLAGGVEDNIPFAASKPVHAYGAYEMKVLCSETSAENGLAGGEFTNAEDVEFAKFTFKRGDLKNGLAELQVAAEVRNGFSATVEQVKLTLIFTDAKKKEVKKFTYEMPGQLKAGEIKPVAFTVPPFGKYEAFDESVGYKKIDQPAATAKDKPKTEPAKFQNIKDVETIFTDALNNDDKSVSLGGAVRNGKDTPVKDIAITVVFVKTDGSTLATAEKVLTDVVRPGEERNFVMKAPNAAGYANYTFSFKYSDLK